MEGFFEIEKYTFDSNLLSSVENNHYVKDLWPLVYIISDEKTKEAYIGETTDAISRMSNHLKNSSKNKLTIVRFVTSGKFNKSATLDIESNLIKYFSGEGEYKLLNANVGIANHSYFQKREIYWDIFKKLWENLKIEGLTKKTLTQIDNSDLFKYSPYKSLSIDQKISLIEIIKILLDDKIETVIIEGGAGTGKTILATFLFKLLNTDEKDLNFKEVNIEDSEFLFQIKQLRNLYKKPSMALVVPMSSFRNTLKKVFKSIKGLSANMVIGPAELVEKKFDILIVDESHRLRKRTNLGNYFSTFDKVNKKLNLNKGKGDELDWVLLQGKKKILFYDRNQSIKPSDVEGEKFNTLILSNKTVIKKLNSQFRVRGGNDYVSYLDKLLSCNFRKKEEIFVSDKYEFVLFESLEEMKNEISKREKEFGLSRMIAGFAWPWKTKNTNTGYDIEIEGMKLRWNSKSTDWINSKNSNEEIGCIHTTQGYDLNYTGVIFGEEIYFDKNSNEIKINEKKYFDKNGKQSVKNKEELKNFILNIYRTILLRGIKGTYVYVCDKNLREYFKQHISMYNDRKNKEIISIVKSPYLEKIEMVPVPLVGSVPCGNPLVSEENIEKMILVDKNKIKSGYKYFILRATGDSMDKAGINDGDLVLCKHGVKGETGDRVVALLGGDVTIKYYEKKDGKRILLPRSTNSEHKPIIPEEEDSVQGVVQEIIPEIDE